MRNTIILPLIIALMSVANAKETLVLPHVGVNLLETKNFDNRRIYHKYDFIGSEREKFLDYYTMKDYIRKSDTNFQLNIATAIVDEEDIPKVAKVEVKIANYISNSIRMLQNNKVDLITPNDYVRDIINLNPSLNFKQVYENEWRSDSLYSIKQGLDTITITYEGAKNGDLYVKNNPNKYLPKVGPFRVGDSDRDDVLDWLKTDGCSFVEMFKSRVKESNLLDDKQSCKYIIERHYNYIEIAGSTLGFPNESKVIIYFNDQDNTIKELIVLGKAENNVVHTIIKAVVEKYHNTKYIRNDEGYPNPTALEPVSIMCVSTTNDKRTIHNSPEIKLEIFKDENSGLIKTTANNVYKLSFKYEKPEDEGTFIKNINPAAEAFVRHKKDLNKDLDKEAEKVKSLL